MHDPLYPGVSGTENEKPQMSIVLKNGLGVIVLNARRSTLTSRNIRATTNDQTCENTKKRLSNPGLYSSFLLLS